MGKLGLPVALAIESKGHEVWGYDVRNEPYDYIKNRSIPYKEKDIEPLLLNSKINMTHDLSELLNESDILFLPVQTPHDPLYEGSTRLPDERKDFDYSYLTSAISSIVTSSAYVDKKITLAVISTCLPGTYESIIKPLLNDKIDYVYTPQFIAMGTVLDDYLNPEFDLIGVDSVEAAGKLKEFYSSINDAPHLETDITTAEGIKVAYNTFITMKTVLANTWGELSEKIGMNVDDIFRSWGMSSKRLLSTKYLRSGVGDGGGCHPRDNIALSWLAQQNKLSHNLFEDLMKSRESHMGWIGDYAYKYAESYDLDIIILGKSFKPETNIETGSPAILLNNLISEKVGVQQYEDLQFLPKALYIIGTQHEKYTKYEFIPGSIVIDPFRYIPDREGVRVVRIGGQCS